MEQPSENWEWNAVLVSSLKNVIRFNRKTLSINQFYSKQKSGLIYRLSICNMYRITMPWTAQEQARYQYTPGTVWRETWLICIYARLQIQTLPFTSLSFPHIYISLSQISFLRTSMSRPFPFVLFLSLYAFLKRKLVFLLGNPLLQLPDHLWLF